RQIWHNEDCKARPTPAQRLADALAELILEPAGAGGSHEIHDHRWQVDRDPRTRKYRLKPPHLTGLRSPVPIVS
ncbi:MAG: hypothetical protein OXH78_08790, partial [Acidimicrobiaceae bacterium]|nr:hypothetical protein [Acidimicrobiaceae bacterium]